MTSAWDVLPPYVLPWVFYNLTNDSNRVYLSARCRNRGVINLL